MTNGPRKAASQKPTLKEYYPDLIRFLFECDNNISPKVITISVDDEVHDFSLLPKSFERRIIASTTWIDLGGFYSSKDSFDHEVNKTETDNITKELSESYNLILYHGLLEFMSFEKHGANNPMMESGFIRPLERMISLLPHGAKVAIPMPFRILKNQQIQEYRHFLLNNYRSIVIEHNHLNIGDSLPLDLIYSDNKMVTLFFEKDIPGLTTLFRIGEDRPTSSKDINAQLGSLKKDPARRMPNGFSIQNTLIPYYPPLIEYYDQSRRNPEGLPKLHEYAEVICGVSEAKQNPTGRFQCLNSDCFTSESLIDLNRAWTVDSLEKSQRLQQFDICIRSETDNRGKILFAQVGEFANGLGFDCSYIVMRLREQNRARRQLIQYFLQSPAAAKFLFPEGVARLQGIDPKLLADLPIPTSIEVEAVFGEIDQARKDFEDWSLQARDAAGDLLLEEETYGIRDRILRIGKDLREMRVAAKRTLDLDYQIIHHFPRPLSFVWAEYKASLREYANAPFESMAKIRKAAETLVAFLALIAASHARHIGHDAFKGWALSNDNGRSGFDFGKWVAILESAVSAFSKSKQTDSTLPEWAAFANDDSWNQSLNHLRNIRNADAHLRIPQAELLQIVLSAEEHLSTLFKKARFLSDYSLRVADVVCWDRDTNISTVYYRELHGATVYSSSLKEDVSEDQLESGKLYLVNCLGKGSWHRLHPFLIFRQDENYKLDSVFHLDSMDRITKGNIVLRSFEFNTTHSTSDLVKSFNIHRMM